jgi:hypothetical protein
MAVVAVLVTVAACPKPRHTLTPPVPTSGNPVARARFLEARARFLRADENGQVAAEFRAIADEFDGDPIEPLAKLYAGIVAEQAGDHAEAARSLGGLVSDAAIDPLLRRRAQLFLGFSFGQVGDQAGALPLLVAGEPAIESEPERTRWIIAMAHAHASGGNPLAGLPWFDHWWGFATAPERAFIRGELQRLVAAAGPDAAQAAWSGLAGRGPSVAILGWRVAADWAAQGDLDKAREVRSRAAPARRAIGLAVLGEEDSGAEDERPVAPGLVGVIVSHSAKQARVTEQVAKGFLVAATALGDAAPVIQIEDADGPAAGDAVAGLARTDALAILGPTDGESVDAAAVRATELGVPLLSLNPRAEERAGGGSWVFHLMHSAEARARTLAREAVKRGVDTIAVLRPKSGYGIAVARAFSAALVVAGGRIIIEIEYPPDVRSFAAIVTKLGRAWEGVFIPDQADRLELIAPALASAGLIARAAGTKKAVGGRPMVLLSTAEGAGEGFLRAAARYSEGALLAPGYFPGAVDDLGNEFERRYLDATGRAPTAVDAYAYDAVQVTAALRRSGAETRRGFAERLAAANLPAVTGTVSFDREHRRADAGMLYTVEFADGTPVVKAIR